MQERREAFEAQLPEKLPQWLAAAVAVLSLLPALFLSLGFDLGTRGEAAVHGGLPRGPIAHALLEWTAFASALFTAVLALSHHRITRDRLTLAIGLALLGAGCADAFHVLAAAGFMDGGARDRELVPFTWAFSRTFNAFVLCAGAFFVLTRPEAKGASGNSAAASGKQCDGRCRLAVASALLVLAAYVVVRRFAAERDLPAALYPGSLVTRPWDLPALVLYALAGAFLLPRLHRQRPGIFSHALLLSIVPNLAAQVHMAFGSQSLYDGHFNAAHFLKIVAYTVPLCGIVLQYHATLRAFDRTRRELDRERRAALEASRSKGEFLAHMSHEIRTPLSAMLGYAEILGEDGLPPEERRRHLEVIRKNGRHLLALLNDVLDLSKIEAGMLEVERIPCSLVEVLRDIISLLEPKAKEKGIELGATLLTPIPETIRSDPTRLRQILLNLVSNAVKFTEKGSVRVYASLLEPPAPLRPRLLVEVVDTGIGIDPATLERLFVPFSQGSAATSRKFGGTGLGLAIARRLARLLGGDIVVQSRPGLGSSFCFTVDPGPIDGVPRVGDLESPQAGQGPPEPAERPRLAGSVLLAEDVPALRVLMTRMLERMGLNVEAVADGCQAVDLAARAARAGTPFDAVFLDLEMPNLDGFEAALELRAAGYSGPLAALSGHAAAEMRRRAFDCGFSHFLTKPVASEDLYAFLSAHLRAAVRAT